MTTVDAPSIDLPAYLSRIGYAGPLEPTLEMLQALHLAHATHIPFENLDVLFGKPILLHLLSLQTKLVQDRRGGYCFEQNTLLAAALEQVGFPVTRLAARVRFGSTEIRPRTHMLLRVDVARTPWLADVGFGGEGLLHPIPMTAGPLAPQFGLTYRQVEDAGLWVLQSRHGESWFDLYSFTFEPQHAIDYEVASFYTSTFPTSIFRRTLTVQFPTLEARHILRARVYVVERPDRKPVSREIHDDTELLHLLADTFGLHFPPGTRLPAMESFPLR
ncbi:MAG TPA: arylamine N-acetyltransferase [Isosphaeraceae bacterium]|jgi:N-hydroxyarylamine O-acetyltransferase|nr:arylamine N-acetyltransferase [Isosphaeraceae bacterium]